MSSQDKKMLPPLQITEATPPTLPSDHYELSLKNVPDQGATVIIQPTDIVTSKDRLQIFISRRPVVDIEFNNNPPQQIRTHIPRAVLLQHLGVHPIHYMIRIGQGNGEMGASENYRITH